MGISVFATPLVRCKHRSASTRRLRMLATLFLPDPTVLGLEHVAVAEDQVTLVVRTTPQESCCPSCTCPSTRIHSRYVRQVADLPSGNRPVHLQLHCRRF